MKNHAAKNRVTFLFVSLPSEPSPEASEHRIRMRVAVVSALSTAGYQPKKSSRLGLAIWDAQQALVCRPSRSQHRQRILSRCSAYDDVQHVLERVEPDLESDKHLIDKLHEIVVLYVEESAIQPELQLEWLKCVSRLLAESYPPEHLEQKDRILARWLGPNTSDRLVELLDRRRELAQTRCRTNRRLLRCR